MTPGRSRAAAAGVVLAAATVLTGLLAGTSPPQAGAQPSEPNQVYRVPGAAARSADLVASGVDLLERRSGDDLFVLGSADASRVQGLGFSVTPEEEVVAPVSARAAAANTYYGGYQTVAGQVGVATTSRPSA